MFAQDSSEEEFRPICEGLAVAQRDDGVDAHSSARGNIAGNQCDERQHDGDGGKGERVGGADAEENPSHQARQTRRGGETDHYAEERQARALSQNDLEHVASLRPQRNAQTDLMRALAGDIGNHAVNSDTCQHEC